MFYLSTAINNLAQEDNLENREALRRAAEFLTPQKRCQTIGCLITQKNKSALKVFLKLKDFDITCTNCVGNTLLHILGSHQNNEEIMNLFFQQVSPDKIKSIINTQNREGKTPIHVAVENNNICLFDHLFKFPTLNVNLPSNFLREIPILTAAKDVKKWGFVKGLLPRSDLLYTDRSGNNILHWLWKALPSSESEDYQNLLEEIHQDILTVTSLSPLAILLLYRQEDSEGKIPLVIAIEKGKKVIQNHEDDLEKSNRVLFYG